MFLSRLFKRKSTKLLTLFGALTMALGVGATISQTVAQEQNEVVETGAATYSVTVYYAVDTPYTMKANPNTGAGWSGAVNMEKTDYTYNSKSIYKATLSVGDAYFYNLQFQAYDGDLWQWQDDPINNQKTSYSTINNKLWESEGSGWKTYSPDATWTKSSKLYFDLGKYTYGAEWAADNNVICAYFWNISETKNEKVLCAEVGTYVYSVTVPNAYYNRMLFYRSANVDGVWNNQTDDISLDSTKDVWIVNSHNNGQNYQGAWGYKFGTTSVTPSYKFVCDGVEQAQTFYNHGGSDHSTITLTQTGAYGSNTSSLNPRSLPGYVFDGWYHEASCTHASTILTGQTLYAKMSREATNKTYFLGCDYSNAFIGGSSATVYIYYWADLNGDGDVAGSGEWHVDWPGIKATRVSNYTFSFTLPSDATHFIAINNAQASNVPQAWTADVEVSSTYNLYVLNTQNASANQTGVWTNATYYLLYGDSYNVSDGVQMTTGTGDLCYTTDLAVTSGRKIKIRYTWYYWDGTERKLKSGFKDFLQSQTYSFLSSAANADTLVFNTAGTFSFYVNNEGKIYIENDAAKVNCGYLYVATNVDLSSVRLSVTRGSTTLESNVRASSISGASTSYSLTFDGKSYVHKLPIYNLRGNNPGTIPTQIIISAEYTVTLTGSFGYSSSPALYVKISSTTPIAKTEQKEADALAAECALAFSQAINAATSKSLCAVDKSTISILKSKYTAAAGSSTLRDDAEIQTWTPGVAPTYNHYNSTTGNVSDTTLKGVTVKRMYDYIVSNYNDSTGTWSIGYLPGTHSENSPLTTTLWIVLGAGMAGLAAIGAAYFVSKKKRPN